MIKILIAFSVLLINSTLKTVIHITGLRIISYVILIQIAATVLDVTGVCRQSAVLLVGNLSVSMKAA